MSTPSANEPFARSAGSAMEPELSLRAVLDWIRERQREIRKLQDAAAEIQAAETVEAKKALYWELDTVAEKINNLRYEAAHSPNARRGWRGFLCDCGKTWKLPTRDHTSPSVETCPVKDCGLDTQPIAAWPDETLAVDKWGNLVNAPAAAEYSPNR